MKWQKMVLGALLTLSLQAGAAQKPVDVTIGVAGSEDAYWKVLAQKAKAENINIKLISFSDYALPNKALASGDVDLNAFQHLAFLSQFNVNNQLTIVPIGATQIVPIGAVFGEVSCSGGYPAGCADCLAKRSFQSGACTQRAAILWLIEVKGRRGLARDA
ncbi:MetQ/NlpA family ABC transporter substrate-binding protein [Pectobacterium versatile]|uniref:MetQ/NlpA family ABC transporter substrate-binding protein n=1 Tax=Pectobacterium versatile TaxID=2488639 RepID=UPI003017042E